MSTHGQIHIPPSHALFSLRVDAVGNCGYRCRENVAFCCSARRSWVVAGTLPVTPHAGRRSRSTQQERGFACGHRSATQTWRWDKGSRRAKALLSGGRVAAARSEVAGMAHGARAARMRRDREFGAIRTGACKPLWGGTCGSVGSGWPLLCCRSRSAPSGLAAAPRPASSLPGRGPGWFFWRKGNDVIARKMWSVARVRFGPRRVVC